MKIFRIISIVLLVLIFVAMNAHADSTPLPLSMKITNSASGTDQKTKCFQFVTDIELTWAGDTPYLLSPQNFALVNQKPITIVADNQNYFFLAQNLNQPIFIYPNLPVTIELQFLGLCVADASTLTLTFYDGTGTFVSSVSVVPPPQPSPIVNATATAL